MGGIGYVAVAISGGEPDQLKKMVDDLVPKIEVLEGVKYVVQTSAGCKNALYFTTLIWERATTWSNEA